MPRFYGTLGYGFSEFQDGAVAPANLYDVKGVLVGFGVEQMVTDRFFVGGEVLQRGMNSDSGGFDADLATLTLRAGMTF